MYKLLDQLKSGETAKVSKIDGCRNATKRLYEMGLSTGTSFEVVKNDVGPVIVSIYGNNVAVGRRLAHKIFTTQ